MDIRHCVSILDGCGESQDVCGALDYLKKSGIHAVHLVGYSFGARVLAGLETLPEEVEAEIYIAPPVAFMDFSGVGKRPMLKLVIAGEYDDIGPPEKIRQLMLSWNPESHLKIIKDGDHFFNTTSVELEKIIALKLQKNTNND